LKNYVYLLTLMLLFPVPVTSNAHFPYND